MPNKMNRGQIQIAMVTGIFGLVAAVGVPIFWVSELKATNTVQDNRIVAVEEIIKETKQDIKELNKKIDALLWRSGIDPNNLDKKK